VDARREVDELLASGPPSVRWKVRTGVLAEDPASRSLRRLREEIRSSDQARGLLEGHAARRPGPYAKWYGAHWVLLSLADLGYPEGADELVPLRDRVLGTWLASRYLMEYVDTGAPKDRYRAAVPVADGRARRCASQQGGALLAVVRLGLDDGRAARLAERLLHWQWPDGGWNCDRRVEVETSSVHETALPLRALAAWAASSGDAEARAGADAAAEVLLRRGVVFRRSDPTRLVRKSWGELRYPAYWHHGLLSGLVALADAGVVGDDRCARALELLQSKRLPGGGWPAEGRWHHDPADAERSGGEHVGWGGASRTRPNQWVTADALTVLSAAGRLDGISKGSGRPSR
jgi:hypothetical protein